MAKEIKLVSKVLHIYLERDATDEECEKLCCYLDREIEIAMNHFNARVKCVDDKLKATLKE